MQTKQKKTLTAVAAGAMAVVMALTGTFAWQSISQRATNEALSSTNPGARLHDDFNGTNKDVYVENFTDPANGTNIFARIRLDEYLEIGKGAGLKPDDADYGTKTAKSLIATTADGRPVTIDDKSTWTTHIPGATGVAEGTNAFHDYYTWDMAGQTVYMPTFNMNKDSLEADINGTLQGKSGVAYDDYVEYNVGDTKLGYEIWDNDDEVPSVDEVAAEDIQAIIDMDNTIVPTFETTYATNVFLNKGTTDADGDTYMDGVSHEAAATLDSQVITMAEWKALGSPIGNYWVYDVDGWAYWAAPIEPGTSTGLLLDGISLNNQASGDIYYAIEVVAQFATAGDWGTAADGTGFYNAAEGTAPTDDALALLNKAAGTWATRLAAVAAGSIEVVNIDNINWNVLAQDTANNKALIISNDVISAATRSAYVISFDDDSNAWDGSTMQTYLNGAFLDTIPTLKDNIAETKIKTANEYDRGGSFVETTEKVFLLSEADVFGNTDNMYITDDQEYTLGVAETIVPAELLASSVNSWLRSPRGDADSVAILSAAGTVDTTPYHSTWAVRPVMWVNLGNTAATPETPAEPEAAVDAIAVKADGDATTVNAGTELQFTATVTKGGTEVADENKGVEWKVEGGVAGTTITDGKLSVAADEEDGTLLTITATSTVVPTVSGTATVTVENPKVDKIEVTADATEVKVGKTLQFTATVTKGGAAVADENKGVTWTVEGGVAGTTITNGLLSVDADETATTLTVKATSTVETDISGTATVTVKQVTVPAGLQTLADASVSTVKTDVVTIDGIDWYVLKKEEGKALIWAADNISSIGQVVFSSSSNVWKDSSLRTTLNGTFLNGLSTLKDNAIPTVIKTADTWNRAGSFIETTDSVFLLTEADVFGSLYSGNVNNAEEYTLGVVGDIVPDALQTCSTGYSWLRSPRYGSTTVAMLGSDGSANYNSYDYTQYVRPALWVNLES